jgi:hypothetical protein
MAGLSLRLDTAVVAWVAVPHPSTGGSPNWRIRALCAATAAAVGGDAWGWPARDRRRPMARLSVPVRRAAARSLGG